MGLYIKYFRGLILRVLGYTVDIRKIPIGAYRAPFYSTTRVRSSEKKNPICRRFSAYLWNDFLQMSHDSIVV